MSPRKVDFVIIGSGPAGQKAAVQAAKAGRSVLVVERGAAPGGECVHRGTIPSKTLRASALNIAKLGQRTPGIAPREVGPGTKLSALMTRLDSVLELHEEVQRRQLTRNDIELVQARARFVGPGERELVRPDGSLERVRAGNVVIATGSRPRSPEGMNVDHEHVLDSDSILAIGWLPASLVVVGAGVIAAEFATIFQALGTNVTMIDRRAAPLGFLDAELVKRFVDRFEAAGGTFLGSVEPGRVEFDGGSGIVVELEGREPLRADKALVALGRTASVRDLRLEAAGVEVSDRGFITVDENGCTSVPGIYAAGDVVGPPALATSSMEQGRRAALHALGRPAQGSLEDVPVGIYTIPEMGMVGLTEEQARERCPDVIVGRSSYAEVARGLIDGEDSGMLKLLVDPATRRLLGAHAIGEGATELIHLAQLARLGNLPIETFVEQAFNFPTMAENYRVAALDVLGREAALRRTRTSATASA